MTILDEARGRAGEKARAAEKARVTGMGGGQGGSVTVRQGGPPTTPEVQRRQRSLYRLRRGGRCCDEHISVVTVVGMTV